MVAQLKLVLRDDLPASSDIETIDLLPWLKYRGWQQSIANLDQPVDEAITLNIEGTSTNNLAQNIQDIDRIIKRVSWYENEVVEKRGVWLRAQLTGESNARQALIIEARRQSAQLLDEWADDHFSIDDVIGLKRLVWEDLSSTILFNDRVYTLGSKLAGATSILGDIPARMSFFSLIGSNFGGGPLTRCWGGFISDRFVNPANFIATWEAENGSVTNGAALTTADDATASPAGGGTNKSVRVDFTSLPTLALRWRMTVLQANASNPADQRGRFLVLGRFKVTDGGTTVNVQLQNGFKENSNFKSFSRQKITGTSWNIYELGQAQIPQVGRFIDAAQIDNAVLRIFAERTVGTGDLCFDCLILIPIGEGSIYFNGGAVQYVEPTAQNVSVYGMADGRVLAVGTKNGVTGFAYNDIIAEVKGGIPTGVTYFVVAAARATSSVLGDFANVDLRGTSRWMTLRGIGT